MEFQATVRCSKIEADADNEDRLKRRSILKCFGATVGLVRAIFPAAVFCIMNSGEMRLICRVKRFNFETDCIVDVKVHILVN